MRKPISPAEAFDIASSWGSYMNDGDPGAVFYTFPLGNALVKSESHRETLLWYTDDCLSKCKAEDRDDLIALKAYFQAALVGEQQ